jgi:hypothetical protein
VPANVDYVVRLRVPLEQPDQRECVDECHADHGAGTSPYLQCIASCPGAEIADRRPCTEADERPHAVCHVVEVHERRASDGSIALEFLNAVGERLVSGAVDAAVDGAINAGVNAASNAVEKNRSKSPPRAE